MARLVVAAAGAGIGFLVGGPVGARIGFMVGSAIGGAMFAPEQKSAGPRLNDLSVGGSTYGSVIPFTRGHPRMAGQVVWASTKREIATTTSQSKGGGGSEYTEYTYEIDLLILLTDNQIAGVLRVWSDGKLIWNGSSGPWARMTVYGGGASQLPDSTYEAAVGTANACAYRGRGTVLIQSLQLGSGGQLPNLTFEVSSSGFGSDTVSWTQRSQSPGPGGAQKLAWGANTFCYVTSAAACATSPDGITWTTRTIGSGATFNGVAYGAGLFVVVGSNISSVQTSPDGATWTLRNVLPSLSLWAFVTWSGTKFVTVGVSSNKAAYSTTGLTWTASTLPSTSTWAAMAWGAGVFCVIASTTTTAATATSPDGITWTAGVLPTPATSGTWAGLAFGAGLFVAVAKGTITCATSPDGLTWTARSMPISAGWSAVTWTGTLFVAVSYNVGTMYATSPDGITWTQGTMPVMASYTALAWNGSLLCVVSDAFVGGTATAGFAFSSTDPSISQVVTSLCLRSGLTAAQFDVSGLASITQPVRGLTISQVSSSRTVLEMLMSTYFFDAVESDKIYFRARGTAPVASITFDELGVMVNDGAASDPLPLRITNELEIPAQMALSYNDINGDYQTATQYSDRLLTGQTSVSAVQVPLGLTVTEAKATVDTMLQMAAAGMLSTRISVGLAYSKVEPTDTITVVGEDGSTYQMRVLKRTESDNAYALDCMVDETSVLTQDGTTSAGFTAQTSAAGISLTNTELLDIPLLRDSDNYPGHYLAISAADAFWTHAAIYTALDGISYELVTTMAGATVIGTASTTLGAWSGGNVFDEFNTVTVSTGIGQLSGVTRDTLLGSTSVNACMIGAECIQYLRATLVSPGVYTLSGLLRGRRGTEWAQTGHAASERFVVLALNGMRFVDLQTSDLGKLKYYKGVSASQALSAVTAKTITPSGVALKPFAPVNARADRTTTDTALTWTRRTRMSVGFAGVIGFVTPLGESSEAYEVEVYSDATFTTLKRTITGLAAPTAVYTSAQQATDFGGDQSVLYVKVYQNSATVGRGYPLTATI